jgi:tetratricopeptide (TPR) repeat protein
MRWLAIAAILVATVAGALLLLRPNEGRAARLLAEASEQQRTSELRFPDAAYAPIRLERGAASSRPAALLEAQDIIESASARSPEDAHWLQLKGRLACLQRKYDDAIAALTSARRLRPQDPSVAADLAAAHFERAQARDDAGDYSRSLDTLTEAIALDARSPLLRFNRAIVYEHLKKPAEAMAEWNEFLRLEPSGGWAGEARSRLAELQK